MRNILAAFLIVAAVVFAGCIGQPTTTTATGNGVIISSFSSDFPEVRSGEEATIMLSLANVGESDATGVTVQLFGLNFGANDWTRTTGSLVTALPTLLRGANPSANLAGDTYDVTWGLKSPANLRVDNTYTADARVNFLYKTTAVSTIRFVSNDYIKSLPTAQADQVRKTAGVISSKVSNAPIQLSSTVGTRPLIVYNGGEVYTVSIVISNAGTGNAFKNTADYPGVTNGKAVSTNTMTSLDSKYLNLVNVNIKTDATINCKSAFEQKDGKIITEDPTEKTGYVSLNRGKSKTLSCSITAPTTASAVGNTKDYTINTQLEYGYFVDTSASIKVLRTDEVTIPGTTPDTGVLKTTIGTHAFIDDAGKSVTTAKVGSDITISATVQFSGSSSLSGGVTFEKMRTSGTTPETSYTTICDKPAVFDKDHDLQAFVCKWSTSKDVAGTYSIKITSPGTSSVDKVTDTFTLTA